jgi:membrane fusion protein (multidrug efflux system)
MRANLPALFLLFGPVRVFGAARDPTEASKLQSEPTTMPETIEAPPNEAPPKENTTEDRPKGAQPNQGNPQADKPKRSLWDVVRDHPIKFVLFLVFLVAAAIGGFIFWQYLDSYESTDDAQIDGNIYAITSRIAGTVKDVYVEDNQQVKAGQVLVDLDPRDFEVAIDQARSALKESQSQVSVARPNVPITSVTTETTLSTSGADITAARAMVSSAQRDYDAAVADIRNAEADNVKAQADLSRYRQLVAKDEISQQQFDQADASAKAAAAEVESKRATAEASARNIEQAQARLAQAQTRQIEAERNRPSQIAIQNAIVASRQATAEHQQTLLDQAQLNRSYTKIVAPVDGVIGRKNAEPGQQVSAGQQLLVDVPLNDTWVTANFKETQLKRMHPGQRATIHVDSYDRDYDAYVESVAAASGARFSLLPPENATGNYVKVVQRVPIRIRLKEGQDPNHLLRPGMSVEPKVWLNN